MSDPPRPQQLAVRIDDPADQDERADVVLGRRVAGLSRRVARRLALDGLLRIDGRRCPPSTRVTLGAYLTIRLAARSSAPAPTVLECTARFVYVLKPAGMHTHRLRPDEADTLADTVAVVHPECPHASPDPRQGGAVHRLDRDTTGVVAFARTADAWQEARRGFQQHRVLKLYRAVVRPVDRIWPPRRSAICLVHEIPPSGEWTLPHHPGVLIEQPLGSSTRRGVAVRAHGRPASTVVWRLPPSAESSPDDEQLLLKLITGHRHQARVHLAWLGWPILGDPRYGGTPAPFIHLHSAVLDLGHACPGEPRVTASIPDRWHRAIPEPDDPQAP